MEKFNIPFNRSNIYKITLVIAAIVIVVITLSIMLSANDTNDVQETTVHESIIETEPESVTVATESILETTSEETEAETTDDSIDLKIEFDDIDPAHYNGSDELENLMKQVADKTKQ